MSIQGIGAPLQDRPPRPIFCDQREHRMYRAIRSMCPCFRIKTSSYAVGRENTPNTECLMESGGIVYFVNKDGLARRISDLFERLDEIV